MTGKEESKAAQTQKEKKRPENLKIPPKKPKLTKAERRELQEKQRAAKAAAGGQKPHKQSKQKLSPNSNSTDSTTNATDSNTSSSASSSKKHISDYSQGDKALEMFSHLPQYQDRSKESHLSGVVLHSNDKSLKVNLHPEVLNLGVKYANGTIRGANARCRAMMQTFKIAIRDYIPPSDADTTSNRRNDLPTLLDQQVIKPSFQHWTTYCRTHSITMGNAISFLKIAIANLSRDITLENAKEIICEQIDAYVQERINFADKVITKHANSKIVNKDVILVYGRSEVIQKILLKAKSSNKNFRVIVTDSRPLLEGRKLLKLLVKHQIPCTYILLNSLSYVMMREVTKVFMGVAALMSDGSVLSRVGTGTVAMIAKSNNIPVLFCCETYKISNRVQLESFTGNELGDPHNLASVGHSKQSTNKWLDQWEQQSGLKLLNLIYDLTPSEYVSGVITEMGILPPTSVAVLLREMNLSNNIQV